MAWYLVRATPIRERLPELRARLDAQEIRKLEPFGASLTKSLEGARLAPDGRAVWEELDYCDPPLAAEREAVLDAHLDKVYAVARDVDELTRRTDALEAAGRKAFSRVGLVRFNPFEETGGNQSFALALLDAEGDGWVLSSLHARSGTRVYAKSIAKGRSEAALSEEETAAIRQATA